MMDSARTENLEDIKAKADEAMQENYGTHKTGFDPLKKADIGDAVLHGEAKMVRNLGDFSKKMAQTDMTCNCCGLPVEADVFPFCVPVSELQELGPGIPLYYWFMKYIIIILTIGFLLVGIVCWVSNNSAGKADEYGEDNEKNFIIASSIGNHGHPDEGDTIPFW
jgi:hypothetical protein